MKIQHRFFSTNPSEHSVFGNAWTLSLLSLQREISAVKNFTDCDNNIWQNYNLKIVWQTPTQKKYCGLLLKIDVGLRTDNCLCNSSMI